MYSFHINLRDTYFTWTKCFRKWNKDLLEAVTDSLDKEIDIAPNAPGGMVQFKKTLIVSFFFKFYQFVQLQQQGVSVSKTYSNRLE